MEELEMAIDFGGSGLKVVASITGKVIAFVVLPHVMEIPQVPKYLDREFSIDLTKNLWVAFGGSCYALGQLASAHYYATVPLIEPKRTYVVPRTLAAVAVAAHRLNLKKFKVNLQLLLPAAEFNKQEKNELAGDLKAALANFDTPIGPMKAKLSSFTAKPEGFGLMRRQMQVSGSDYQVQSTAVVMFGHRNTSLYLSSGGEQQHYRSNDTGFIRAIEAANVDQVKAIANPKLVDQASIDLYWNGNAAWLKENWPESATTAIVGGGPLAVIGDRVIPYLNNLMESSRSSRAILTFINGRMPVTPYEESVCKGDKRCPELLSSWPEGIGIQQAEKQQFADVYCLWATRANKSQQAMRA
jgi:hypothetical protein